MSEHKEVASSEFLKLPVEERVKQAIERFQTPIYSQQLCVACLGCLRDQDVKTFWRADPHTFHHFPEEDRWYRADLTNLSAN